MNSPSINLEVLDSIAHLTIDDPPKNEMSLDFFEEFKSLRQKTFLNLKVRGMIVSGKGRHFSSGANVKSLVNALGDKDSNQIIRDNHHNFSWLENAPFPVVAAISGCCLGSGLELALACHYRIATKRAVFAFPEVEFGLIPGCGGTVRLKELVSIGDAVELLLTGRSVLADEARDLGMVDLIVEKNDLLDAAIKCIGVLERARC